MFDTLLYYGSLFSMQIGIIGLVVVVLFDETKKGIDDGGKSE